MNRQFDSFLGIAEEFGANAHRVQKSLEQGLERALVLIEKTALSEFGVYQDAVGPHPGWVELADSTKDDRLRQGFTENDPLLRSGDMMRATKRERHGLEGVVGNTDEKMAFHEFGTSKMPARPVYGPAGFRNIENLRNLVGAAAMSGLIGEDTVHAALGYDQIIRR